MAAITYMKTELNYSKYIFHDSISHNLQPIRKNESNIKYYWIIFTMSLFFYANNSTTENRKPFLLWFLWYSLSVIVSPALTQFSETLQQRNFLQLKFYVSPTKLMSFLQICTSNYSLLAIWRINTIACTLKWY